MRNSCVRCGKEFASNISLDKHARRCKPTTNATRSRKRARLDEEDNRFAENDDGGQDILGSGSSIAHNVCTLMRVLSDHDGKLTLNFVRTDSKPRRREPSKNTIPRPHTFRTFRSHSSDASPS